MALDAKKGIGVVGVASSRSHPVLPGDEGMLIVVDEGEATVAVAGGAGGGSVCMVEVLLFICRNKV